MPLTPTTSTTLGALGDVQRRRLAEHHGDLLDERLGQVAGDPARLQPLDELCRRRHADVGGDQRLFEPLPRPVVGGVERRDGELVGERAPALPERVPQAPEEALRLLVALRRRALVAQ